MGKTVLFLLLGVVILFGIVSEYQGLEFALALLFLLVLFGGNIYQSYAHLKKKPTKKFRGYTPREEEDVFYDSRLRTLRKAVVNKELDELQYKQQRDELAQQYNEGKVEDKK